VKYINLNGAGNKNTLPNPRYQTPILNGAGNKNTLPNPYINFGLNGAGNKNTLPNPYIKWGRQQKHVTHHFTQMFLRAKTFA